MGTSAPKESTREATALEMLLTIGDTLEETGVNTKMAWLYGWAPVGERCRDAVPFGHWKTMTFTVGLRLAA